MNMIQDNSKKLSKKAVPVSLAPLKPEQALLGLLQIKPLRQEKTRKKPKKKGRKNG
jgi:hypothetical protein